MFSAIPDAGEFKKAVLRYVAARKADTPGVYTMCDGGAQTLYSTCFAVMITHYFDELPSLEESERQALIDQINHWQCEKTGRYIGPEMPPETDATGTHDWDHITMHQTAHVLPALALLGAKPAYPLHFAHRFLNKDTLNEWLSKRDWSDPWLEGNNLLFVGQFLIHMRDVERIPEAQAALDGLFNWLNAEQDSKTGLWATDKGADTYTAAYGAYHQLLLYYAENRTVPYADRMIDTCLALQHPDGSFSRYGGGGACEDVDVVDMLINLNKRTGYRSRAVRRAANSAADFLLRMQMHDGGFVYRRYAAFSQMGIEATRVPPNISDMFSTWFRVHTIALCMQLLPDHPLNAIKWQFNSVASMGWHDPSPQSYASGDLPREPLADLVPDTVHYLLRSISPRLWRSRLSEMKRWLRHR